VCYKRFYKVSSLSFRSFKLEDKLAVSALETFDLLCKIKTYKMIVLYDQYYVIIRGCTGVETEFVCLTLVGYV